MYILEIQYKIEQATANYNKIKENEEDFELKMLQPTH
jgi:hypothetical protein